MKMNGIFLTEQGKQEIEAIITELETWGIITVLHPRYSIWKIYKEILSSATIIPVDEVSTADIVVKFLEFVGNNYYYNSGGWANYETDKFKSGKEIFEHFKKEIKQ
jgi:hypothetical protein